MLTTHLSVIDFGQQLRMKPLGKFDWQIDTPEHLASYIYKPLTYNRIWSNWNEPNVLQFEVLRRMDALHSAHVPKSTEVAKIKNDYLKYARRRVGLCPLMLIID